MGQGKFGLTGIVLLAILGWWAYDSFIASHWEAISYLSGNYNEDRLLIRNDIKFKTVSECVAYVRGETSNIFTSECGYKCSGPMNNASLDIKCKNWAD